MDDPSSSAAGIVHRLRQSEATAARLADRLHGGGGGGTFNEMEPRVAKLEAHAEHANKQLDRLASMPADLARLQERVAHLPSKGFIVTSTSTAVALLGAIVIFADKLRLLIGG